MKRADGGFDPWPDESDPAWQAERARVMDQRDRALWRFYCLACLPGIEPPAGDGWLEEIRALGIKPREGAEGRRLDWIEFCLVQTDADLQALREAFRDANDIAPEDRAAAVLFFNLRWNGVPIREAAEGLERGKLTFAPGWAQFLAAERWGAWPIASEEVPAALRGRLPLLYYDLPPRLRARMEEFCESEILVRALQADDAWRRSKAK